MNFKFVENKIIKNISTIQNILKIVIISIKNYILHIER
jgi:hypothetical protein